MRIGAVVATSTALAACTTFLDARPSLNAIADRIGLETREEEHCGAEYSAPMLGHPVAIARNRPPDPHYRIARDDELLPPDRNTLRLNIYYNADTGRIVGIKCG